MPTVSEQFDPHSAKIHDAGMWTTTTPTVHAGDYRRLLDLYDKAVADANSSQKQLQGIKDEIAAPEFYLRALNCSHQIDAEKVVLNYDPKQEGKNALDQLSRRLTNLKVVQNI
jgi:hypothetical protein